MSDSKFSLSRGLKDVVIAEITADGIDAYTPSAEVEQLIPAGTITMSADSEKTDVYFDNVVFASAGTESATTVTIWLPRLQERPLTRQRGRLSTMAYGLKSILHLVQGFRCWTVRKLLYGS